MQDIEIFTQKALDTAAEAGFDAAQMEVLKNFTVKLVGRAK